MPCDFTDNGQCVAILEVACICTDPGYREARRVALAIAAELEAEACVPAKFDMAEFDRETAAYVDQLQYEDALERGYYDRTDDD